MTDWKQKIEAQIAEMHYSRQTLKEEIGAGADTWADTTQALLDVAVAADTYLVDVQHDESEQALFDALDKLRELDAS